MSIKLHALFSDNMMFQAHEPMRVWGQAKPAEKIRVSIGGKIASTRADHKGAFEVQLAPLAYGGPHTLQVNNLKLKNVLSNQTPGYTSADGFARRRMAGRHSAKPVHVLSGRLVFWAGGSAEHQKADRSGQRLLGWHTH